MPQPQRPQLRRPLSATSGVDGDQRTPTDASRETADGWSVVSAHADNLYTGGKLQVANPDSTLDAPSRPERSPPDTPTSVGQYNSESSDADRAQGVLDVPLRRSPSPTDGPDYHNIPHTALSVISEGDTYISTPGLMPLTIPEESLRSPPTIPSLLSSTRGPAESTDLLPPMFGSPPTIPSLLSVSRDSGDSQDRPTFPTAPNSPPLPDLPLPSPVSPTQSSVLPPSPIYKAERSPPTPTPIAKYEHSLPPTPRTANVSMTADVTPAAKPVPLPVVVPQAVSEQTPMQKRATSPPLPPLPVEEQKTVLVVPASTRRAPYVEHDLLSRASMIVNPPTPSPTTLIIPNYVPESMVVASPKDAFQKKDGSQRMRSRTETFKLVRSNSGEARTLGHSAVVEGEHWEVVESPTNGSPTKRSRKSRRDGNKTDSDESDPQKRDSQSRRRKSMPPPEKERYHSLSDSEQQAAQRVARAHTLEAHRHSRSLTPERRSSRSPDGARATRTPVAHGGRVSASSVYTGHATNGIERRTSTSASTRPTSAIQATADTGTLKARDAWEMERLWKGRSVVYGGEGVSASSLRHHISNESRPSTVMGPDLRRASTIPSVGDLASHVSPAPGSNHTYFVVQAPYQGTQRPAAYAQYSSSQTPVIYSVGSNQEQAAPSSNHQEPGRHRSFSDTAPFRGIPKLPDLPAPRSNPLPEPPRLSSYRPAPVPPSLVN